MPDTAYREAEIETAWQLHHHLFYGGHPVRTPQALIRLAEAQNWRCCYCRCRMQAPHRGPGFKGRRRATFEHVVPRSLGCVDEEINLVIACYGCNQDRRADMRPEHWEVVAMGFRLTIGVYA